MEKFNANEKVKIFLEQYKFERTYPVNLIKLADLLGYKIFYTNKEESENIAVKIDTNEKKIKINIEYQGNIEKFLKGRYLIAKMISHIALNNVKTGDIWIETKDQLISNFSEERKIKNIKATAFLFQLLMPEEHFRYEWKLLDKNKMNLSIYFGVTQGKIMERAIFLGEEENA